MPIGSATSSAVPPQLLASLMAIQQTVAAELQVSTALERGFQTQSAGNPNLGQLVNLTV